MKKYIKYVCWLGGSLFPSRVIKPIVIHDSLKCILDLLDDLVCLMYLEIDPASLKGLHRQPGLEINIATVFS